MPNETRTTYVKTLTEAQQLTHNAITHSLIVDIESSILTALNRIYSDVMQVECLSNLSRNVFRCVPDTELQQTYLTDPLFRNNIWMIPGLSFVLIWNVILAFHELCNHCRIDEQPVFDYIETNYIGEMRRHRRLLPLFPNEMWNMHNPPVLNKLTRQLINARIAHSFLYHAQTKAFISIGVYQNTKAGSIT